MTSRVPPGRWVGVVLLATLLFSCQAPFVPSRAEGRSTLPLSRQIGQMIVVGFRGTQLGDTAPVLQGIRRGKIGGVVLYDYDVPTRSFGRNITGPDQLCRLTRRLQRAGDPRLLIGVDQEGGAVNRLKPRHGFSAPPSAETLGRLDAPHVTRRVWERVAQELRRFGVNLNFAPVLDLNTRPDNPVIGALERSFSADPEVVLRHARVVVGQLREAGVLSVLKHFPGHGSSRGDSHEGWVDVTGEWSRVELRPFEQLLAGLDATLVMVSHLYNRRWDPSWPASLSESVVRGMLREEVGFNGVVITDDLQMGAIRKHFGLRTVVKRALEADVDLLMFANNTVYRPRIGEWVHGLIAELVRSGAVSERRIERSYRRIRTVKRWLSRQRFPERESCVRDD